MDPPSFDLVPRPRYLDLEVPTMERDVVVLGGTPGAVRAAAACARRGRRVTWILPDAAPEGPSDLPEGRGSLEVAQPPGALAEAVLGPLVPLPDPSRRALAVAGRIHPLPIRPRGLSSILGPSATRAAAWGLARVRTREAVGGLVGAWSEIRSYRDWVSRRYGEPLANALYGPYCRRRWGDPGEVGAAVARLHHAMPAVHDRVAPAEGPAARAAHALAAVEAAGGRVIAGVSVQRFVVREGRVATILLARRRRIRVEGEVLVAHPPAEVAGWLGEAIPDPIHAHAGRLSFRHALEVLLPADDADLPDEIHLVGPGGPFFRITLPGRCPGHTDLAGHVLLHATLDPDDPLWRAPDADIEDAARAALAEFPGIPIRCGDAHIRRLEEDQPCWTLGSAPSWLRVRAAFASLGVVGVGRSGTFGHLDPLGEVRFLEALLADVPLREAHRLHVDPPFDAPRRPGELPGFVYR